MCTIVCLLTAIKALVLLTDYFYGFMMFVAYVLIILQFLLLPA